MTPRVAVVAPDANRAGLARDTAFRRRDSGGRAPTVSVKRAIPRTFHLVVESSESRGATTAERPCHGSPRATTEGLDDQLVFFELTKRRVSPNPVSVISPGTSGSGRLSPYARIRRYTSE
jgi:hypothetical protein